MLVISTTGLCNCIHLQEASSTSDYDVSLAIDQMLTYLASEQGSAVRELLTTQLVSGLDQLQDESLDILLKGSERAGVFDSVAQLNSATVGRLLSTLQWQRRGVPQQTNDKNSNRLINRLLESALNLLEDTSSRAPSSSLAAIQKVFKILRTSNLNADKATALARRVRRLLILFQYGLPKIIISGIEGACLAGFVGQG